MTWRCKTWASNSNNYLDFSKFPLVTKYTFFQIILVSVDTKYQSTQADGSQSYQGKFYFQILKPSKDNHPHPQSNSSHDSLKFSS